MRFSRTVIALLPALACCVPAAFAQNFPNKPMRVITGSPGGANDMIARLVAQGLSTHLGQAAVVLNRPGSQVIPIMEALKSAPDGYTMLAVGANQFWLQPFLKDDVPYDPVNDFAPVSLTATSPNMIVVHNSVPATNVKELIALAKSKPGVLNYGIGNFGSSPHLAGELFKAMSQTNLTVIPYKGTGPAMIALLAGQTQVQFPTVSSGMQGVKTGKLRALAVTTERPSPLAPGLPTVSASGLPGYESSGAYAVFAPAKTPANIVGTLNGAIAKYFHAPEMKEKMFAAGLEIVASSPQELAAAMKQDRERMGKVIKEAGIRSEE